VRSSDGRFLKGNRYSPNTEFKKGQHWRQRKNHWSREWLHQRYVVECASASEIANESGCTEAGIYYWLKKLQIPRRSVSGARAIKKWGAKGSDNPMYGRYGKQSPRYIDGSSPLRQKMYARGIGKDFVRSVLTRDKYRCKRCNSVKLKPKHLHVHHIRPWAGNELLRFDLENAITLCQPCHSWVHSKRNTNKEYLK